MCGLVTRSVWRAYHRGCMSRLPPSLSLSQPMPLILPISLSPSQPPLAHPPYPSLSLSLLIVGGGTQSGGTL